MRHPAPGRRQSAEDHTGPSWTCRPPWDTLEPVTAPAGARAAHLSPPAPARDHLPPAPDPVSREPHAAQTHGLSCLGTFASQLPMASKRPGWMLRHPLLPPGQDDGRQGVSRPVRSPCQGSGMHGQSRPSRPGETRACRKPLPVIGAEAARAQVDHRLGSLPRRSASSASIALSRARIRTNTGEPGIDRARLTRRSRRTRSSSPAVRPVTSCGRSGSGTGQPRAVFLLASTAVRLARRRPGRRCRETSCRRRAPALSGRR